MRKCACLLVALPFGLLGQNLSIGLIGGGSLTDAVRDVTADEALPSLAKTESRSRR
jgi:hypothetical protein